MARTSARVKRLPARVCAVSQCRAGRMQVNDPARAIAPDSPPIRKPHKRPSTVQNGGLNRVRHSKVRRVLTHHTCQCKSGLTAQRRHYGRTRCCGSAWRPRHVVARQRFWVCRAAPRAQLSLSLSRLSRCVCGCVSRCCGEPTSRTHGVWVHVAGLARQRPRALADGLGASRVAVAVAVARWTL
jgi:hypothetical protein